MKYRPITKTITENSSDLIKIYFKEISKIPVMTYDEECDIYTKILNGDNECRKRLVEGNLRFCISIAKQYQGQGIDIMDLIDEANIGLIKASNMFDPNKNVKFLSYAIWWIRESIIKALTNTSRAVRIPISRMQIINNIVKFTKAYEQEFQQKPSFLEIEQGTGISVDRIIKALGSKMKTISLDMTVSEDSDFTYLDIVPSSESTDSQLIFNDSLERALKVMEALTSREKCIIKLYFGLESDPLTLDEIGERFGISAERVRQIKDASLCKLRELIDKE